MEKNILDIMDHQNFRGILLAELSDISAKRYCATKKSDIKRLDEEVRFLREDIEEITEGINEAIVEIFKKHRIKNKVDFNKYCEELYNIYKSR